MLRAVLFDLDGTLLRVDTYAFVEAYVRLLAGHFANVVEPDRLVPRLLAATQAMMASYDPALTNQQVFASAFYPALGLSEGETAPGIAEFYERVYPQLRSLTAPDPAARRAVEAVLARGMDSVVATNPIFPLTAVLRRVEWAGLGDLPFALVTSYETSHFCKLQPEYFHEVASQIGRDPRECLMVGNEVTRTSRRTAPACAGSW